MYAGGQNRGNGGGGSGGRDALLRRRRQPGPSSPSPRAATATASSSPSGQGEEAEEGEAGGGKKLWRRRKQGKAVVRAIRDGLPAAAASCWRGVTLAEEAGSGRTRRRHIGADGSGHGGDNSNTGEGGSGPVAGTAPAAAWCCVCPGGDCSLEPNPSANGKEDPALRSLLERNDFFAADCNPHTDGLPSSS
jgi:hypothetical protein